MISADQMVLYYGFAHRSVKWRKRVFFHILDTAIVNAHIIYNACSDVKLTQLEFRRAVAEGLLSVYEVAKARRHSQDPQLPVQAVHILLLTLLFTVDYRTVYNFNATLPTLTFTTVSFK